MNFYPGGKLFDLSANFNELESDRVKIGCGKTSVFQMSASEIVYYRISQVEKNQPKLID